MTMRPPVGSRHTIRVNIGWEGPYSIFGKLISPHHLEEDAEKIYKNKQNHPTEEISRFTTPPRSESHQRWSKADRRRQGAYDPAQISLLSLSSFHISPAVCVRSI
jgi:hypothetical protein